MEQQRTGASSTSIDGENIQGAYDGQKDNGDGECFFLLVTAYNFGHIGLLQKALGSLSSLLFLIFFFFFFPFLYFLHCSFTFWKGTGAFFAMIPDTTFLSLFIAI